MIGHAGKIGVGESDAAERSRTQYVSRCGLSILTKEKSGRGTQIRVTPAIQNYSRDVAPGIKARASKHLAELLTNLLLVLAERRCEQFGPAGVPLLFSGLARIGIQNFQSNHG